EERELGRARAMPRRRPRELDNVPFPTAVQGASPPASRSFYRDNRATRNVARRARPQSRENPHDPTPRHSATACPAGAPSSQPVGTTWCFSRPSRRGTTWGTRARTRPPVLRNEFATTYMSQVL